MESKKAVPIQSAHRILNAGSVLLVTSAARGHTNIMTLAWQTPISAQPRLLGIAVGNGRFTTELIGESGEFVLNVAGADLLTQVARCGRVSGRDVDKFQDIELTAVPSSVVGAPSTEECLAHVECRVVETHVIGDHHLFVGEIVAASARDDLFVGGHWVEDAELLHHLGGNQYYISGRRVTPPES